MSLVTIFGTTGGVQIYECFTCKAPFTYDPSKDAPCGDSGVFLKGEIDCGACQRRDRQHRCIDNGRNLPHYWRVLLAVNRAVLA